MSIGKHTYKIENLQIYYCDSGAKLYIGNFCSIGSDIKIFLGGNHRHDWVTTYPFGHIHQDIFNFFLLSFIINFKLLINQFSNAILHFCCLYRRTFMSLLYFKASPF